MCTFVILFASTYCIGCVHGSCRQPGGVPLSVDTPTATGMFRIVCHKDTLEDRLAVMVFFVLIRKKVEHHKVHKTAQEDFFFCNFETLYPETLVCIPDFSWLYLSLFYFHHMCCAYIYLYYTCFMFFMFLYFRSHVLCMCYCFVYLESL